MHKCRVVEVTPLTESKQTSDSQVNGEEQETTTPANTGRTTEMSTRRRMITITKNMVQGRTSSRRGRQKRMGRPPGKRAVQSSQSPQVEPQQLDMESENIVNIPAEDPFQVTEATEISVVVSDEAAAQYVGTQEQQSALVHHGDGSVVVIQPLSTVQSSEFQAATAIALPIDTSTSAEQYEIQADLDQKDVVYPSVSQEVGTLVSASGDMVPTYSLEYQAPTQQGLYQPVYTSAPTYQSATLISTGPNMATLVVEGPSGEVISRENITTIVTQNPEDYNNEADAQSYSVLQYPLSTAEGEHITMEAQDITAASLEQAAVIEPDLKVEDN